MKKIILIFFLFIVATHLSANSYFQQSVRYKIKIVLNVKEKTYNGQEQLIYHNNSPDTLRYIWMHLYPNAFKTDRTAYARQQASFGNRRYHFSKKEDRGYLNLTSVKQEGMDLTWTAKGDSVDEVKILLARPVFPGDSIKLDLKFEAKFPKVFSRIGYFDEKYFAGTQWYPKVVVYDRRGWHPDSYLDLGEFYGEYGSFDVEITLPRSYVIDATGMLQDNPQEEAFMRQLADTTRYFLSLSKKERKRFIKRWLKSKLNDIDYDDTKTVRFVANNVHNFAWFAGPAYMLLRKVHNNGVLTNVLVTPKYAYAWRHVPEYVEKTVAFYGAHVGPYQYPKASVVDGALKAGGGMEYPMITIISSPGQDRSNFLEMVVMHEVGHNWFMGMLGSDERACTFLDEGMNSFLEYKYMEHYHGRYNLTNFKKLFHGFDLLHDLGERDVIQLSYGIKLDLRADQPMDLRAEKYTRGNYAAVNYHKGIAMLLALEWYLTPPVFWRGMHTYFDRWNGKHPAITDFFQTMSDVSGKDLSWFVNDWFHSTKYCDFRIAEVKSKPQGGRYRTRVWVENLGTMKDMPAPVTLITENGDTLQKRWSADPNRPVLFTHDAPVKKVVVNARQTIFETDYLNNQKGLPEIKVHFFPQIPEWGKYPITILPFYYYESFVDRHQIGTLFWSGNPIYMQWFVAGNVYYATKSKRIGFGLQVANRYHFSFANFSDVKFSAMDKDGMKAAGLILHNFFIKRDDEKAMSSLDLGLRAMHLYDIRYDEPGRFEPAKYSVAAVTYNYSRSTMLTRFALWAKGEKAIPVADFSFDYTKLEMETTAKYYFGLNRFVDLRLYAGGILTGDAPLQESVFAAGDIDPKHEQIVPQRRGKLALNRGFNMGHGMRMYGYNGTGNPFFNGKVGASFSAGIKMIKFIPQIYGSVATIGDELSAAHPFAEAGIKLEIAPIQIVLPLYISDPAPGEKHLGLRAMIRMAKLFNLGF